MCQKMTKCWGCATHMGDTDGVLAANLSLLESKQINGWFNPLKLVRDAFNVSSCNLRYKLLHSSIFIIKFTNTEHKSELLANSEALFY